MWIGLVSIWNHRHGVMSISVNIEATRPKMDLSQYNRHKQMSNVHWTDDYYHPKLAAYAITSKRTLTLFYDFWKIFWNDMLLAIHDRHAKRPIGAYRSWNSSKTRWSWGSWLISRKWSTEEFPNSKPSWFLQLLI